MTAIAPDVASMYSLPSTSQSRMPSARAISGASLPCHAPNIPPLPLAGRPDLTCCAITGPHPLTESHVTRNTLARATRATLASSDGKARAGPGAHSSHPTAFAPRSGNAALGGEIGDQHEPHSLLDHADHPADAQQADIRYRQVEVGGMPLTGEHHVVALVAGLVGERLLAALDADQQAHVTVHVDEPREVMAEVCHPGMELLQRLSHVG